MANISIKSNAIVTHFHGLSRKYIRNLRNLSLKSDKYHRYKKHFILWCEKWFLNCIRLSGIRVSLTIVHIQKFYKSIEHRSTQILFASAKKYMF